MRFVTKLTTYLEIDHHCVVRSGRYPATAFFGRLMSSLHSGMAA